MHGVTVAYACRARHGSTLEPRTTDRRVGGAARRWRQWRWRQWRCGSSAAAAAAAHLGEHLFVTRQGETWISLEVDLDHQDAILVDALERLEEAAAAQALLEGEGAADVGQVVIVGLLRRRELVAHLLALGRVPAGGRRSPEREAAWRAQRLAMADRGANRRDTAT